MRTSLLSQVVALAMAGASLVGCAGKIIVTPVPASVAEGERENLDGVLYALPRTVIKVTVSVERTNSKIGTYADYMDLFFPEVAKSGDYVKEDGKRSYSIGKSAFGTFGEPDLSKLYYVKLTGGWMTDRTASLEYTEQGTVSGIQASADNNAAELFFAAIGALSGIVPRIPVSRNVGTPSFRDAVAACLKSGAPADSKVRAFFAAARAEELTFNYCRLGETRRGQIADAVQAAIDKTDPSLGRALKAYTDIRDLLSKRRELITQTGVNSPLPSLDLMLKQIDVLAAQEMGTYFSGQQTRATWTPIFELRPISIKDSLAELLKIDEAEGVCLLMRLHAQDDPPPGFASDKLCSSASARTLRVKLALDSTPQIFQRVQAAFKDHGDRSFRYLIPAATLVTLESVGPKKSPQDTTVEIKKRAVAVIAVAQFGAEVSLPASSGGRSLNYNLKFFEATGALKSFGLTSKAAMQATNVNSMSTSTNAYLDAKLKQEQAAKAEADTLNKLERQRKILEDEAKIRELCAQLNIIC